MKLIQYILSLIFIAILGYAEVFAQQYNSNLEFFAKQKMMAQIESGNMNIHTTFKPFALNNGKNISDYDSVFYHEVRDRNLSKNFKSTWLYRKLRTENFIEYKSPKFSVIVNPLLNVAYTKSADYPDKFFLNSRGIEIKGHIGNKITYYSSFYENQARFVPYVADYVRRHLVAPGQGAVKILKADKFDFSRASAYLNIAVNKNIGIQLGHGKHFIGNGYRSLLLSDNSFNYPYLRFDFKHKQLQYTVLWAQYQMFKTAYYNYHHRKYSAISQLSWLPKSGIELSLFESVMWAGNTPDDNHKFNLNFFNPVIFSRTAIYGLNNEKNILLGLNARIKLYKYAQFFAQFALDNIDSKTAANNNYAYQIGFKHFDLLHNSVSNAAIFVQAEFNYIAPYTYSWENVQQSYSHYNQPLTHAAGSGLQEFIAIAGITFRDFALNSTLSYIKNSADKENTNFGSNIFMPNIINNNIISHKSNTVGNGMEQTIVNAKIELSYTINPINNMQLFASFFVHSLSNNIQNLPKQQFLSFGIRTNINNYYYDF